MMTVLAAAVGLFLAYANGSNDNFKGVATLYGSGTTNYRRALAWGTLTTFLGSITAIFIAHGLIGRFSGRGLVPDDVVAMKAFGVATVFASASTVWLASRLGLPISTTHALTGGLVGAGCIASQVGINFANLGSAFFLPLLLSPLVSALSTLALYPVLRSAKTWLGIERESCLCLGTAPNLGPGLHAATLTLPHLSTGTLVACRERYTGSILGVQAGAGVDGLHLLSSGVVSFARGLNDTPKIAALLLLGGSFSPAATFFLVASAMAGGGLLHSRAVAETLSHGVTSLNPGQGVTANLVTGSVVIGASLLGLPVSTTHVSCGTLFGIGAATQQARWKSIMGILLAWITTLPIAGLLGALAFAILSRII